MKNLASVTVVLILLILSPSLVQAQNQQDSIKNRIETIDGNEYIGTILEQTNEKIRLKTDNLGEISISTTQIKKITPINQLIARDGTYWLDNPQATRYFWAPNGYNLKQGEGLLPKRMDTV